MKATHQPVVEEEEKPVEKKTYTYDDLNQFKNTSIYSSVGKMLLSTNSSAPNFGFGTSTRQKQTKVYQTEELSRTHLVGKTSPGPNYEVRHTDKFTYKDDPSWTIGKELRNIGLSPKHAHYTRMDLDFDPIMADDARKTRSPVVKVGLESRFGSGSKAQQATPGPEYSPNLKPEIPNSSKYSFGFRREVKGASPLVLMASTPNVVGPATYNRMDQPNTSVMPDHPEFSFPKDPKLKYQTQTLQKNQTYDTRSGLGEQVSSKNRSNSQITIPKANKEVNTGIFKDHMSMQQTKLRIAHPRF